MQCSYIFIDNILKLSGINLILKQQAKNIEFINISASEALLLQRMMQSKKKLKTAASDTWVSLIVKVSWYISEDFEVVQDPTVFLTSLKLPDAPPHMLQMKFETHIRHLRNDDPTKLSSSFFHMSSWKVSILRQRNGMGCSSQHFPNSKRLFLWI